MSKILIYLRELILPSTSISSSSLISETAPEYSRIYNYHEVRDIQIAKLHQDVSTHKHDCLNQPPPVFHTLFQSLFKVYLSFDRHQCTLRCLFSVRMVRVLQIYLFVNLWNRNRLRTVLEEIVFGKTLFTMFVISVKVCHLSIFT